MPITNKYGDVWNDLVVKKNGDIYLKKDYIGYVIVDKYLHINKKRFLRLWEDSKFMAKLVSVIPDDYRFNYYYLSHFSLSAKYRGSGLGGVALQKWFLTLEAPACVGTLPTKIANVPEEALQRFYRRNGFKLFQYEHAKWGFAFIKSN